MEDSERKRPDLEELLQIKTEHHHSSLSQHTEQMERQCRLVEALQNQTERLQGYFRKYEGMFPEKIQTAAGRAADILF